LAQRLAWPALGRGENLLLASPTGTGKSLAALLPIVGRLCAEQVGSEQAGLRCLVVVPMKALGRDLRKNLRRYLKGLTPFLGPGFVSIRSGLRTGDTSSRVRRRILRDPPALLITTPESLAVMLSHAGASAFFADVRWVVVDELHAVANNKRGADLALSLERLEELRNETSASGPIQRIGLTATCAPLTAAARFLVGAGRPCTIAEVTETTRLDLRIEPLPPAAEHAPFATRYSFLARLLDRLDSELKPGQTTLIFTNVRSLAERLTWALRRRYPEWAEQIGVHHSALSAARRRAVERRLKLGKLRVVVSSTSLELGMDIGSVDRVVLVHPPGGVIRLLQRVGRSGHGPQRPRHGLVLTASPGELLEATVTAGSIGRGDMPAHIEPLQIPDHPLDVLCQHLVGMGMQGWWTADRAFAMVRRAFPYRQLAREDFDASLAYLSGRDCDGQEWLPARLRWEDPWSEKFESLDYHGKHGEDQEFSINDERTARLLRRNLGTIISDETRPVLLSRENGAESGFPDFSLLGEVDDLFAEQLQPGDRFVLDGRCLEFQRRDRSGLLVGEVLGRPRVPRWAGTGWPLSEDLARRLFLFRVQAAEVLRESPAHLFDWLQQDYGLDDAGARELSGLFTAQETVSEIPDLSTCLIECTSTEAGTDYHVHTPLNRAGNDALARVAGFRLGRQRKLSATAIAADLGILLSLSCPCDLEPDFWRDLLTLTDFDAHLDRAVQESLALRERFRQVALTGLMLLRNPLGRRRRVGGRDWAERRLFDQVEAVDPEFVLLRQARREMARDACAAEAARSYVRDLDRLVIRCRWLPQVSPLAEAWS
jgi:ATP-dependent Lhr-like helicase